MSKHAQHHTSVMHDILVLDTDELQDLYGIEIDEDGSVWDPFEGKSFDTVHGWAAFTEALAIEDDHEYVHQRAGRGYRDDDGY